MCGDNKPEKLSRQGYAELQASVSPVRHEFPHPVGTESPSGGVSASSEGNFPLPALTHQSGASEEEEEASSSSDTFVANICTFNNWPTQSEANCDNLYFKIKEIY